MKEEKLYLLTFLLTSLTTILTFNSSTSAMNIPRQKKVTKFRKFTPEEDKRLKDAVYRHTAVGENRKIKVRCCWKEVAEEVGGGRTVKQCRGRWHSYLSSEGIKKPWTEEQEIFLLEKQGELGNKWAAIARLLGDKSAMDVKNRYYTVLRRRSGISTVRQNQFVMVPPPPIFNQPVVMQQNQIVQAQAPNNIEIEDFNEFPNNFGNLFDDISFFDDNFTNFGDFVF